MQAHKEKIEGDTKNIILLSVVANNRKIEISQNEMHVVVFALMELDSPFGVICVRCEGRAFPHVCALSPR